MGECHRMRNLGIRPERPGDRTAVSGVNRAAFGGSEEAELVERLGRDGDVVASLVAVSDGEVMGHILFSKLSIATDHGDIKAAALAPMAVAPALQRRGVGGELIREGLRSCKSLGIEAVIVLGHEAYYPKFDFSPALTRGLEAPFSGDAFMAIELTPGVLRKVRGRVNYARAFGL